MNKKLIIFTILIIMAMAGAIFVTRNNAKEFAKQKGGDRLEDKVIMIPSVGKYCYVRKQEATTEAPYSAEEHITLNYDGRKVSGVKTGTQAGPDMTNGYEGTLEGLNMDGEMELTYAYTVEGSQNRELEIYAYIDGKLTKKRWPLKEVKINDHKILAPTYAGEPTLMTYETEECK